MKNKKAPTLYWFIFSLTFSSGPCLPFLSYTLPLPPTSSHTCFHFALVLAIFSTSFFSYYSPFLLSFSFLSSIRVAKLCQTGERHVYTDLWVCLQEESCAQQMHESPASFQTVVLQGNWHVVRGCRRRLDVVLQ